MRGHRFAISPDGPAGVRLVRGHRPLGAARDRAAPAQSSRSASASLPRPRRQAGVACVPRLVPVVRVARVSGVVRAVAPGRSGAGPRAQLGGSGGVRRGTRGLAHVSWGSGNEEERWTQPEAKKRVLITGAGGTVGTALRKHLGPQYAYRLLFFNELPRGGPGG